MIDSIAINVFKPGPFLAVEVAINEVEKPRALVTCTMHGGHGQSLAQAAYAAACEARDVVRAYSPTAVMPHAW
jgi:hypothetical protein